MQAADYADGRNVQPPLELIMAYNTAQYGNPYTGGWLEWPAGIINRMRILHTYAECMSLYRHFSGNQAWVKANPHIFEKVTQIWQWRKEAGYEVWH